MFRASTSGGRLPAETQNYNERSFKAHDLE